MNVNNVAGAVRCDVGFFSRAGKKNMDRYYIDERSGCIAVRDRERTDPDYNGLHADTEGVAQYWGGHRIEKKCSECGHVQFAEWEVSEDDRLAAAELCDRLNLKPNAESEASQ